MRSDNTAVRIAMVTSGTRYISRLAQQSGIDRIKLNRAILGQISLRPEEKAAVAAVLDRDVGELFPDEAVDA